MDMAGQTFSSNLPFSIFRHNAKQYSLSAMSDKDTKAFMWHQFMLDVLLNIPRSPADKENIIAASYSVYAADEESSDRLDEKDIEEFRQTYKPEEAIKWYTRASFLYRTFNKACRSLNSNVIIQFHSFVKDLDRQLKQVYEEQEKSLKCTLPRTVYRGQATWSEDEVRKLRASQTGDLLAMNTFLSTSFDEAVAYQYIAGASRDTSVVLQITIGKDVLDKARIQKFALVREFSYFPSEEEVLFGMSSVFEVLSVEETDTCLLVHLKFTTCEKDTVVKKLVNEVKSHLYQMSGHHLPFNAFKQLLNTTSHGHFRPLTELMKFVAADLSRLFLVNACRKDGRTKQLIDADAPARAPMVSNESVICFMFDVLNRLLYSPSETGQEQISFGLTDRTALVCFGAFLLMIGEFNKGAQYFVMLLRNDLVDHELKVFMRGTLEVINAMIDQKQLALTYLPPAFLSYQLPTQTSIPPWFAALKATAEISWHDPHPVPDPLEALMNRKQVDDDMQEKFRLLLKGILCSQQQNYIEALNHWEEAVDIVSYAPFTVGELFNAVIRLQMANAYFRLENMSEALNVMRKGLEGMEAYYPPTHRMFASLNFLYGYYLLCNERPLESIPRLEKALTNPYFTDSREFLGVINTTLVMANMQSGNIERAEYYCYQAAEYQSPTNVSALIPSLLEMLPQVKSLIDECGVDMARQFVGMGLQYGQQMLSNMIPGVNALPDLRDDQIGTCETFILYADRCRHRQDYTRAEMYYAKALTMMTETESSHLWDVYRKLMRMNQNGTSKQCRDYFIEQSSKYDDSDPKHLEMICTLQIVMYQLLLMDDDIELAFDCLIYGVVLAIKSIYYQTRVDSNYVSNFITNILHRTHIAQVCSTLSKALQLYSDQMRAYLHDVLLTFIASADLYTSLAKLIHHPHIEETLHQRVPKLIAPFLDALLQLCRRCVPCAEMSVLSFYEQLLEWARKYRDQSAPMYHFVKTLESIFANDERDFLLHLDKLRTTFATFERYQAFKAKVSYVLHNLQEDQLLNYLAAIAKTF